MKSLCLKFFIFSAIFLPESADGFPSRRLSMFELASIMGSVPARWPLQPAYMHTFGITENYFVIVEQPLSISIPTMMQTHLLNDPMGASFKWYQDQRVSMTATRYRHIY